jgi:hypothetical protein
MMFNKKRNRERYMDSLAAEVTRSAALTDDESEAAIASPLFFSRIRATIDSQRKQVRDAGPTPPVLSIGAIKLALSGLTIVAAVAFWLVRIPVAAGHSAYSPQLGPTPSPVLTACSISATTACAISTGDVLQLLLNDKTQEVPK